MLRDKRPDYGAGQGQAAIRALTQKYSADTKEAREKLLSELHPSLLSAAAVLFSESLPRRLPVPRSMLRPLALKSFIKGVAGGAGCGDYSYLGAQGGSDLR